MGVCAPGAVGLGVDKTANGMQAISKTKTTTQAAERLTRILVIDVDPTPEQPRLAQADSSEASSKKQADTGKKVFSLNAASNEHHDVPLPGVLERFGGPGRALLAASMRQALQR